MWKRLITEYPERASLDGRLDWEDLATLRLHWLVQERLAVHPLEATAVLAESSRHVGEGQPHVQPLAISEAKTRLLQSGLVEHCEATTRGGSNVGLLLKPGSSTKTLRAAARKRLLAARYLGWATGNATYRHGIIGPTGERVARQAIAAAGTLRLSNPNGEVARLLGVDLRDPLDSGGILATGDLDNPGPPVAVAIEVKSIRDWVYPNAKELYQLLDKAARVSLSSQSSTPVLPVLICRRAHYTTFKMAEQLGFFVVEVLLQYVSRNAVGQGTSDPEGHLESLRLELGLEDLRWEPGPTSPDRKLVRRFREVLPGGALQRAQRWTATVTNPDVVSLFHDLRTQYPHHLAWKRAADMNELRRLTGADGW